MQQDAGLVPGFKSMHCFLHLESLTTKERKKAAELSSGFSDTLVQSPSFLLGRTLFTDWQARVFLYSGMHPEILGFSSAFSSFFSSVFD